MRRHRGLTIVLCQLLGSACGHVSSSSQAAPEVEPTTSLVLETAAGEIEIELFERAAPVTVARLQDLVAGSHSAGEGVYGGLTFDFARPHIEIVTASPEPAADFTFANEIDARSLGLDERVVADAAEAMAVVQHELLPKHREKKKGDEIPPQLSRLLDQWYDGHTADFLIGVSRQEINEALGHVYQRGLESRPALRGSVLLQPISANRASARLCILLSDVPQRTGRWMVIGEVTRGLEVAQAISVRPRVKDRRYEYRPVDPVVIYRARIVRRAQGAERDVPQ